MDTPFAALEVRSQKSPQCGSRGGGGGRVEEEASSDAHTRDPRACGSRCPWGLGTRVPSGQLALVWTLCSRYPSGVENSAKTQKCGILN